MKIVLNRDYGGFWISENIKELLPNYDEYNTSDIKFRMSKELIDIIESSKFSASHMSSLKVIEFPNDAINPYIDDYDGIETLREGRYWD